MYLQSILIVRGDEATRQERLGKILSSLGFAKLTDPTAHPNINFVSPEEEKLSVGVEKIRSIRSWLAIKSISNLPKVVVIQNAPALTESAQNAFLKTLEEPPENTYIVLLSPNTDSLLSTIVSRCQIISLSESLPAAVSEKETKELTGVLEWIESGNLTKGFAWAKDNTDRKNALETIVKLIIVARGLLLKDKIQPVTINRLFEAKKYLLANTNVRLTLENLFL